MLNLTQPRYVMPVPRRLQAHPAARRSSPRPSGCRASTSSRARTACRWRSTASGARFGERETSGMIFVDGVDIGDVADVALRDRRMLSADGIFIIVATVSEQDGSSVAAPEVLARGVPFLDDAERLRRRAARRRRGLPGPRGRAEDHARSTCSSSILHDDLAQLHLRAAQAPAADGAAGRRRGLAGPPRRGQADHEAGAAAVAGLLEVDPRRRALSATARTIARPRPPSRRVARRRGRSARRPSSRSSAGMPGPSSSTSSTTLPVAGRHRRRDGRAGGVWRDAFSIRFSASRCSSSRAPSTYVPARRRPARASWPPGHRLSSAAASTTHLGRGRRARAGGARPASARASSSRSATSRRMRREERSAERGGLALLAVELLGEQLEVRQHAGQRRAQLVRGVGDELALAVERGLASPRARRRATRASPPACGPARRPRPRPSGRGSSSDGSRVRCDLARGLGELGDRRHRAARDGQARPAARAPAPPSTPQAEEEPSRG